MWLVYQLWICHLCCTFLIERDLLNGFTTLSSSICKVNYLALQRMENSKVLVCVCAKKNLPYLKPHLSQRMMSFLHHLHLVRCNPFRSVTPSLFRLEFIFVFFLFNSLCYFFICSLQNWRTLLKWICLMFREILEVYTSTMWCLGKN